MRSRSSGSGVTMDPVTIEILRNRLRSISREMATTFIKTAFSASLYDGRDCSTAILDDQGQLLTLDCGVPLHIAPMAYSIRDALRQFQGAIEPGDVFIMNNPYQGGTHLPDVLVFAPVFCGGELAFVAGARGHWTDVGGAVPGSLSGKAREIHQEGMMIPPVKLYQAGRLNSDVMALILSNMRVREERAGDIRAALAACKVAERRCHEVVDRYGLQTVRDASSAVLLASEQYFRSIIRTLPKTRCVFEDYLDSDGVGNTPLRIRATVTIEDDNLTIDFGGTSRQAQGPYNASLAVTQGAVFLAMKVIFDPKGPVNEGTLRPLKILVPPQTLLNAEYPAPTGGFGEVAYRAAFTVIGALAKLVPERVAACDYGAINHCFLGFTDDRSGRRSVLYAYAPPGGNGGTYKSDGASGMKGPIGGNVDIQSLELVENLHPVIYRSLHFRRDSGGAGKYRGGLGTATTMEVRKNAVVSIVSDRCEIPPFGLFGGFSGLPQEWEVRRGESVVRFTGGKAQDYSLNEGDRVVMHVGGGGGYGDPLERNPALVQADVVEGRVSIEQARQLYGVVLSPQTGEVDGPATDALRSRTYRQRLHLRARRRTEACPEEGLPVLFVNPKLFRTSLAAGALVELQGVRTAAPLRAVVTAAPDVDPGEAWVDQEVMAMLECNEGDDISVRDLRLDHTSRV